MNSVKSRDIFNSIRGIKLWDLSLKMKKGEEPGSGSGTESSGSEGGHYEGGGNYSGNEYFSDYSDYSDYSDED